MKRSLINGSIDWAKELLAKNNITLPAFAYLTPGEWAERDKSVIRKTMLGWDVTDFNSGQFEKIGGVLFTVRNGCVAEPGVGTPYAEKYILLREGQALPMHMHRTKSEDIINRSGGTFVIRLYEAGNGGPDPEKEVRVYCDGEERVLPAGAELEITTGNSITLKPYLYHSFWAKEGDGDVVIGEVSSINDDNTDNVFVDVPARFSAVEEDEPKRYVLCNEYE